MTPEALTLLQGVIDDTYEQFVDAVAEGRGLTRKEGHDPADGRVYTGRQAVDNGLVDAVGDLEDATRAAAKMAGLTGTPRVYRRVHRRWIWDQLSQKWSGIERRASLTGPRLLYRM